MIRLKKRKTNENIEEEIKISKRWIRSFTELYALLFFKANPDSSGYDICKFVESEYGFKISYSRIYPLLNELERKGIISVKEEVSKYPPKRVYRLTSRGIKKINQYRDVFLRFLEEI